MRKQTTEQFIIRAKEKFGDKYDYSKVVYKNCDTKVIIGCPIHGDIEITPYCFLKSKIGCPDCGRLFGNEQGRLTTEEFIQRSRLVHGDKYDYSDTMYVNAKKQVEITCPVHGKFKQRPFDHLNGKGCNECGKKSIGDKKRKSATTFIEEARKVHGNKYNYSKIEYKNCDTEVTIKCPIHGDFPQTPKKHLKGQGCPYCGNIKTGLKHRSNTEEFIKKAKQIHGDKYDYSKVKYIRNIDEVEIVCSVHGTFKQQPDYHLRGHGCHKCANCSSNGENEIFEYIQKNIEKIVIQRDIKTIKPKELDIYIPDLKLAIEYNGVLWHSEQFNKDKNYHLSKTEECEKQGIRLIHIFEDEYLEHKEIVLAKIRHILHKDNGLEKVYARKCTIKEIDKNIAKEFLEKNHIQGYVASSIYLGCFYKEELIAVMTFKKENKNNNKWELSRFATDITKCCVGVGGKMFSFFIKKYDPSEIKSFADRRWTLDKDNNLYIKLGFILDKIENPDYRYANGYKREHKFGYRKQKLLKNYPNAGLTEDMTEYEMTQKLGFYRIWDCGLFKYVWKKIRNCI